jgi:glutathionylspermidine synthase
LPIIGLGKPNTVEGSNIYKIIREGGINLEEDLAQGSHRVPDYDHWGYMYQKWHNLPIIDNTHPIIGSWVIGDKASGMSIREDANLVTGNDSFFASHFHVLYEEEQRLKHLYE